MEEIPDWSDHILTGWKQFKWEVFKIDPQDLDLTSRVAALGIGRYKVPIKNLQTSVDLKGPILNVFAFIYHPGIHKYTCK